MVDNTVLTADCPHPGPLPLWRAREKFVKGFWLAAPLAKTPGREPPPGTKLAPYPGQH